MEILRQLWRDAQTVLRDMSTTQRVAVTFLIITVAGWLTFAAWMGSSSTEASKRPLPIAIEPGDANDMLSRLKEKGIKTADYDFDSRRIIVNLEEEKTAVIALAEEGLLMGAHEYGFEAMLDKWAFSDTRLKSEESMRYARANEVARLIESLDSISEAQVIYSDDARTSLFGIAHKKTASVRVKTKLKKALNEETANTIISLVSAAKAGLDERDVVVSDQSGNKFHSSSGNSLSAVAKQKWDTEFALNEELRRKLENLMRQYIPNVQYEGDVNAFPKHEVDFDYTEIMFKEVLPGQVGSSSTTTYNSKSTQRPHEEPGVNPNVRRAANLNNMNYWYINESSESRKTNDRTNQNSIKETATKVSPKVTNLTISAIIHLPYRLRRDEGGNPIQAVNEYGVALIDAESRLPQWERESIDPLPAASIEELKRQIAQASGIPLAEIPEKIEVSQVPWIAPVHSPSGGETLVAMALRWISDNKTNIITFIFFCLAVFMVYRYAIRPIPTEVDEEIDQDVLTLSMATEPEDDEQVDEEWEDLRSKVATAVQEDPKRAAGLLKRWMRKE